MLGAVSNSELKQGPSECEQRLLSESIAESEREINKSRSLYLPLG